MRILIVAFASLIFALGIAPATAAATVTPIKVGQTEIFKHKPSGIAVDAVAADIPRVSVGQYDDKQLDLIIDFRTPDQREITTIYLFRNVSGDVPLWFDRIQRTVEATDKMGKLALAIPPTAFVPAGRSTASGLHAIYAAAGPWKSSVAGMTSVGEWYVSIRASSQTLTPEQLLARVEQSFAAIRWPREKVPAEAVEPITACGAALPQGTDAEPIEEDAASAMAGALVAAGDAIEKKAAKAVRWCRDPFQVVGAGVYRPNGATDRYFIAFQDAGRGTWVSPNEEVNLIAAELKKEPSFAIELIDIDQHAGYGSFKTLPNVAQALWTIEHGSRVYKVTTWGKDRSIELNTNVAK